LEEDGEAGIGLDGLFKECPGMECAAVFPMTTTTSPFLDDRRTKDHSTDDDCDSEIRTRHFDHLDI
jgi:hypothetical protein